jgi:hypothetical protein
MTRDFVRRLCQVVPGFSPVRLQKWLHSRRLL